MGPNPSFRLIGRCRGCHAGMDLLVPCFEMDPMPLAGQFCSTAEEAIEAERLPLSWMLCQSCGLVQVTQDVDEAILFRRYNYASSTVSGLVDHFKAYAGLLTRNYDQPHLRFLEIGCNDGVLLRRLPATWLRQGVDPSDVACRSHQASQGGYELVSDLFDVQLVESMRWQGQWDVISGSNCLAHISDLHQVFTAVRLALKEGGEFWVEVHDLEALLCGSQWDTIYHEHKAEWSLDSLTHCLGLLGFECVFHESIPMHGGALRCCFRKTSQPRLSRTEPDLQTLKAKLKSLAEAYRARYEHPVVRDLMKRRAAGQSLVAYGAAGRANVFLNQTPELAFDWIVDESTLRQGRYLPHIATPIVAKDRLNLDQPHHCLITAWNYARDIRLKNPGYRGQWWTAFG